jgi:arabinofuranan 3-O-arabinosyltransferase
VEPSQSVTLRRTAHRVRVDATERWWPIVAVLAAVSAILILPEGFGDVVADNRFEVSANPWQRVVRSISLWDGSRGLGDVREDVWPLTTLGSLIPHSLGAPVWLSVRIWHVTCLTIAAVGVVAVLRTFRPRIGPEHLLAGLIAVLGPYSLTFLVPSNLYLMFALTPWLAVTVMRGVTTRNGWKWAAWFALIVGLAGNADIPGLVYGMVPSLVAVLYLVSVERRTTWPRVAAWFGKAAVLTLFVSALTLTKTVLAGRRLADRLAESESPAISAVTSSWSESIRGLGNWLSYFGSGGVLLKPNGAVFFENVLVVLMTFVVPVIALLVWRRRDWPVRLLFVLMMVVSVTLMVGGFGSDQSPIARLVLDALESVPALGSLRNTYKAAAGLVIGSSILAALGAVSARAAWRRRTARGRRLPDALIAIVLLAVAAPAVLASVYHPDRRAEAVPTYWTDAATYLNGIEAGGRVLVLPAVSRAPYRWGSVGDDLLDALIQRPHAVATGVALSAPLGADAVEAITLAAQDRDLSDGTVAQLARRLGFTEILIRNDLDWQAADVVRPSQYDHLRGDPALEPARTFGAPGLNVVDKHDTSAAARREKRLAPVEVYRVRDSTGPIRISTSHAPLVVSGDARSWPTLVESGLLADGQPSLASGASTTAELGEALDLGASVVITDTPRRRERSLLAFEPHLSHTLSAGEELRSGVAPLFEADGAEAVTWFPDALRITGSTTREVESTSRRPALAFDGDPETAWSVPRLLSGGRVELSVELRTAQEIGRIAVQPLVRNGIPSARVATASLSDGTTSPLSFGTDGLATIDFGGRITTSITFSLTRFDPRAGQVGVAEIDIDGLDLTEYIQAPDDLARKDEIAERFDRAPLSYVFTRVAAPTWLTPSGREAREEELHLNRRFHVPGDRTFDVEATLRPSAAADSDVIRGLASQRRTACVDIGARILRDDHVDAQVLTFRRHGDPHADPGGTSITMVSCDQVELSTGWHRFTSGDDRLLDTVTFRGRQAREPGVAETQPPTIAGIVTLAMSFDRQWSMVTEAGDRFAPMPVDGVNGWYLPRDLDGRVTFVRSGEHVTRIATAVSLVAVLVCGWLILRARRSSRVAVDEARTTPRWSTTAPTLQPWPSRRDLLVNSTISVAATALLLGWVGVVLAVGVTFVMAGPQWLRRHGDRVIDAVPAVLLALAAIATAFPPGHVDDGVSLDFSIDRRLAHDFALVAFGFIVALMPWRWRRARQLSSGGALTSDEDTLPKAGYASSE